jgi:hypothetical protein
MDGVSYYLRCPGCDGPLDEDGSCIEWLGEIDKYMRRRPFFQWLSYYYWAHLRPALLEFF